MSRKDLTPYINDYIDGKMGIDIDRLINRLSRDVVLDDVSIDEMRSCWLQQHLVPFLNSKDFFSVKRGTKKYVSLKCGNPAILNKMLQNRDFDMDASQGGYVKIQKALNIARNNCEGQTTMFGGIDIGDGIRVEYTEDDIMRMVDEIIETRTA